MTHPILSGPIIQPPKNPLDDFDPNERPKAPFATYCPHRRNGGPFKLHRSRPSAINGLRFQGVGVLYEWREGRWEEIARFNPPEFLPSRCENCNQSMFKHPMRWDYSLGRHVSLTDLPRVNCGRPTFVRVNSRGRLLEPLTVVTLCAPCGKALGY